MRASSSISRASPTLDVIRERDGRIEIGAAVTQNKLMAWPQLATKLPLVAAALPFVGHFQTRNRGTVCGSMAHADPSSELPLALAVAGGEIVLRSRRGERVLAASDFQKDMLTTARAGDELIVAARFPVANGAGIAFREVARRHGDFAIIAVAALADDKNAVRLGVGGMAGRPMVRRDRRERRSRRRRRMGRRLGRLRGPARLGGDAPRSVPQSRAACNRGGDAMRRVDRNERVRVALTLNGRKLSADAEPRMLLCDFLRHALGATGTHVGCEHGVCGSCTVLIDGVAARSCLTLRRPGRRPRHQDRGVARGAGRRAQSVATGVS